MDIISRKRCIIGEGPAWNEKEGKLYFTNGGGKEICILDIKTGEIEIRKLEVNVAAIAFTEDNRLIVSREDGVFILNEDNSVSKLYDTEKTKITYGNDMKVGPDGRIYVGTMSGKRKGVSDKVDGKLWSIDKCGNVKLVLDNLSLSNGFDWSMDEKRFYHTDSDMGIIKEYNFDKTDGRAEFSGRTVKVPGVDGLTIDKDDRLYAACWGSSHIAVIDTKSMEITDYIPVSAEAPASCAFAGEDMDNLVVVTASYDQDIEKDPNAGYTFIEKLNTKGRKPYIFEGE